MHGENSASLFQERTGDEVQSLLNQAEICVAEARIAASLGRHNSAAGLLSTAVVIYQSVVRIPAVEADENLSRRVKALLTETQNEGLAEVGAWRAEQSTDDKAGHVVFPKS